MLTVIEYKDFLTIKRLISELFPGYSDMETVLNDLRGEVDQLSKYVNLYIGEDNLEKVREIIRKYGAHKKSRPQIIIAN